jgi:AcrR family transcriptional regulator
VPVDPDPVLPLLWRHVVPREPDPPRRGPRQRLTLDQIVDDAIDVADGEGLAAVTMRVLARRLGIGAMTLYTYVENRNDLVVLMVDQSFGRPLPPMAGTLRDRLRLVAEVQLDDCRKHPWLLEVHGLRPWLGPNVTERYEWQLSAVEGVGLDDVEMDQAVTLVVGFASNVARSEQAVRAAEKESGVSDLEWWEANAGPLSEVMAHRDYPIAGRVGQAAGEAYQAGTDPARELSFGLERIIDGIEAYVGLGGAEASVGSR